MLSLNFSNCWKPLRATQATTRRVIEIVNAENCVDWAISSEATKGLAERSTTRESNQDLMKSPRMGSACEIGLLGDMVRFMVAKKLIITKQELSNLYGKFGSLNKVAIYLGVSKKLVLNYMKRFEIKRNLSRVDKIKALIPEIAKMASKGMTTKEISVELGLSVGVVKTNANKNGIEIANTYHKGFLLTHNGYKKIPMPGHPHADKKGYVHEHRVIAEEIFGGSIPIDLIVHHRDGNKLNNKLENLEVMTKAEHVKIHNLNRWGK